jgi:hypothetical protein
MDRRGFVSFLLVVLSGCLGTGDTNNSNESDGKGDTQGSDDWSQRDLNRTGETPYVSDDGDENILSQTGRDLIIEGGTEDHEIRVELRDDGETFYSVEDLVPANATVTEQDIVRKRGVYEVQVYVGGDRATTFDWRVDDGHSTALVRLENGVTTRVGEVSGALTLIQVDGHEEAPSLNETNLLEHDAVAEAFERVEDCADDPGQEGCNYFADEDIIGVQVTGVEGEELDALYRRMGSVGEGNTGGYVEKNGRVYEMGVETPL